MSSDGKFYENPNAGIGEHKIAQDPLHRVDPPPSIEPDPGSRYHLGDDPLNRVDPTGGIHANEPILEVGLGIVDSGGGDDFDPVAFIGDS